MRLKACQQIAQRTGADLGTAARTARQLRQLYFIFHSSNLRLFGSSIQNLVAILPLTHYLLQLRRLQGRCIFQRLCFKNTQVPQLLLRLRGTGRTCACQPRSVHRC